MPSGFFAFLDDIAALLDDAAVMTDIAAKKAAGLVGKDVVTDARQTLGIRGRHVFPVLRRIVRGSLINKAILVPAAATAGFFAPAVIPPLLFACGLYLCHEGAERFKYRVLRMRDESQEKEAKDFVAAAHDDHEKSADLKARKAIRTDFILSAEILILSLGKVTAMTPYFLGQLALLGGIGVGAMVAVYSFVGVLLKMEDWGLGLRQHEGNSLKDRAVRAAGYGIVHSMPHIVRGLSVIGTAAMLGIGGGIMIHAVPFAGPAIESVIGTVSAMAAGYMPSAVAALGVYAAGWAVTGLLTGMAAYTAVKKIGALSTVAAARHKVQERYESLKTVFGRAVKPEPAAPVKPGMPQENPQDQSVESETQPQPEQQPHGQSPPVAPAYTAEEVAPADVRKDLNDAAAPVSSPVPEKDPLTEEKPAEDGGQPRQTELRPSLPRPASPS